MAVYIVRQGLSDYYKIGQSRDFTRRLSSLQMGSPIELVPILFVSAKRPLDFSIESALHQILEPCKVRGEWFDLPIFSVDMLVTLKKWLDILGLTICEIKTRKDIPLVLIKRTKLQEQRASTIAKINKQVLACFNVNKEHGKSIADIANVLSGCSTDQIIQSINGLTGQGYLRKKEGDGTQTLFFANKTKHNPRVIYCYKE